MGGELRRKAFVTGAGGFIGSHLVETLLARKWKVKALVHYHSCSSRGWLQNINVQHPNHLEVIFGDIRDPYQMKNCIEGCDVVFHLAALIGIPYSYVALNSYYETNVLGTLNVAKAALDNLVKRFIHTSTSEVYGTAQYTPIDEDHHLQGQSPYSASKIGADKLIESFVHSFDFPATIIRPFNTYGPHQSVRAVIPSIILQAQKRNEVSLGLLEPVRDLTYVSDTVNGLIAAAEAEKAIGRVLNLGTNHAVSIEELAKMIFQILHVSPKIVQDQQRIRPPHSEVMKLISNNSLAKKILDWEPKVPLFEGLNRTIEWIDKHRDSYLSMDYAL
ncbi:SDR family NAD(P)-dependent oxidoreductase [bacterium]|nr:SDR family NAD(P)-dependent oxidoreductase [bacterium]